MKATLGTMALKYCFGGDLPTHLPLPVPSAQPELPAPLLRIDGALLGAGGALGSGPEYHLPAGWIPTLRMLVGFCSPPSVSSLKGV